MRHLRLCIATLLAGKSAAAMASTTAVVPVTLPALKKEATPLPREGVIWSPGYWKYDENQFLWCAGHWELSRPAQQYVAPHWVLPADGWHFAAAAWLADPVAGKAPPQPDEPPAYDMLGAFR